LGKELNIIEVHLGDLSERINIRTISKFLNYYIEVHYDETLDEGLFCEILRNDKFLLKNYSNNFYGEFQEIPLKKVKKLFIYESWGKNPFKEIDKRFRNKPTIDNLVINPGSEEHSTSGLPDTFKEIL